MSNLKINYQFKNKDLLLEALTHKSFSIDDNKDKLHNERFEFLGDSVLNFVIAADLVDKFKTETEGFLSKKRASLVNQNILAEIAKSLQLQEFLRFGPGEIKQGSPLNPRILASALEAIIGAIYIDSDFQTVEKWVLSLFKNVESVPEATDFKTKLQELTQKHKMGTPIYELVFTTGPSHKPKFVISLKLNDAEKARADGASKKAAEQKAAELFLNQLLKEINQSRQKENI